jgi:hypothetical protein
MSDIQRCAECAAVLMPGAPFCTTCWTPLPDPEPSEPVTAEDAGLPPVTTSVPDTVPAEWAAAAVPAGSSSTPFAPPAPPGPPAGMPPGWRPPADPFVTSAPSARSKGGLPPVLVGVLALIVLVLGAGGYLGYRAVTKDTTRSDAAAVFAKGEGGPFGDFMLGGSREAALAAGPDARAEAAAWLPTVEAPIVELNRAIGTMQGALDSWAAGKLDAGQMAQATKAFQSEIEVFNENFDFISAPEFLSEDVYNLVKAAMDWTVAADALLLIIDGRKGIQEMGFGMSAGSANVAWDAGIDAIYGAAGMKPAHRPNKP